MESMVRRTGPRRGLAGAASTEGATQAADDGGQVEIGGAAGRVDLDPGGELHAQRHGEGVLLLELVDVEVDLHDLAPLLVDLQVDLLPRRDCGLALADLAPDGGDVLQGRLG